MSNPFFERPILNSPYEYPSRHWELDASGQPTQQIIERRRRADFITPIPKPKKQGGKKAQAAVQPQLLSTEVEGLSTTGQKYDPTAIINAVREQVDKWRALSNPDDWGVTPETQRLLKHWRHHKFSNLRPFFCQIEAVEAAIWLTEVAPNAGKKGKDFLDHLANANHDANPEIMRLALKLATGAGKTTVMAMLIAWQTVNAVRYANSKRFTRGFLIVAPGLTIKDRLRVLHPNDPDSYYAIPAFGEHANTVTHVLGVRAFSTQLLCEQVIGRALRRQSYDLNEEGLFNVEYADVLGTRDFATNFR